MNYSILSISGYKMWATTEAEARAKADAHTREWAENGAPRVVTCTVYYAPTGTALYTSGVPKRTA